MSAHNYNVLISHKDMYTVTGYYMFLHVCLQTDSINNVHVHAMRDMFGIVYIVLLLSHRQHVNKDIPHHHHHHLVLKLC